MAGFEADTSSYPKPLPAQSPLQTIKDVQGIDAQAMSNANQALGYLTRAMAALGPNATKEQQIQAGQQAVKLGLAPASSLGVWIDKVRNSSSPAALYNEFMSTAASHQELFNIHLGQQGYLDNGQQITPIRTPAGVGGSPYATGLSFQKQPDVGTVGVGPGGAPQALGAQPPQLPAGAVPGNRGIPGQFALPAEPPPSPSLPVGNVPGVAGPSRNFGGTVVGAERLPAEPMAPRGPILKQAPGVGEAQQAVGTASGVDVARELEAARTYAREVFPLQQAIPSLERLGTKGTGPGTETINQIKSFVLSNVPGVKESDFNGTVADYDKAKKYLVDFVNSNGATGTNDKLAAAFAGSPSVNISNAAAVDVAKSALALRNMRQAQILEFQKTGLTPDKFSSWAAQWTDQHDPRAFGVNLLTKDAADKLYIELHKKGREKELANFERSLQAAAEARIIKPPGQ